ncbi:YkgJ family cysteine cluster protein [Candidatus Bathyarchaeota archaeon A05DMB-2]|jgi:Fe-S-cluster containining protein|nr:YkgJ family cysteine cluster protein [Candidatus Bathyarchaeota archaeon A05DMB-2]
MDFDYPTELRFKCIECGKCCGDTTEKTRHILLLRKEAEKIAEAIQQPVSMFAVAIADKAPYTFELRKTVKDGKCVFLVDNRYSIYVLRPLICRFYPFELKPNEAKRHTFSYTDDCSGVNRGEQLDEAFFRKLFQLACDKLGEPEKR